MMCSCTYCSNTTVLTSTISPFASLASASSELAREQQRAPGAVVEQGGNAAVAGVDLARLALHAAVGAALRVADFFEGIVNTRASQRHATEPGGKKPPGRTGRLVSDCARRRIDAT
jgi:hypothetical protein